MAEKFIDDIVSEQQRIADLIVHLKSEIEQVSNSVGEKEKQIQDLAGKLDVLKQVHDFYVKGVVGIEADQMQQPQEQIPQPQPTQEPQSVFTPEQNNEQP